MVEHFENRSSTCMTNRVENLKEETCWIQKNVAFQLNTSRQGYSPCRPFLTGWVWGQTSRSGSIPSCMCPSGLCNVLYTYLSDKAKFV